MDQNDSPPSELDYEFLVRVSARAIFANITLTLVAIGVHVFMAVYGLSVFLETPKNLRKGRAPYIIISFLISGLSALSASLDAFWIFKCLFEATSALGFYDTTDKYGRSWERVASVTLFTVVIFIGDGLLLYRCYIIWRHRWWTIVLPTLTYLASVGMGIVCLVPMNGKITVDHAYEASWIFLNVSTNVMVTFLISFHLLRARSTLSKFLPSQDMTVYTGVIAVLIESALPLSVFGLVHGSLLLSNPKTTNIGIASYDVASNVFSFLYYAFSALAPHMIIFRITTGRSWVKSPPRTSETITDLQFDHHPEQSFIVSSPDRNDLTEKRDGSGAV